MKTLDEVIETAPYVGTEWTNDALYYLRMYRSDMQMYAANQKLWEDELAQKIKDFGDAKERYIARLKELDIGTLNEPLTMEDLKDMVGEPVWNSNIDEWGLVTKDAEWHGEIMEGYLIRYHDGTMTRLEEEWLKKYPHYRMRK